MAKSAGTSTRSARQTKARDTTSQSLDPRNWAAEPEDSGGLFSSATMPRQLCNCSVCSTENQEQYRDTQEQYRDIQEQYRDTQEQPWDIQDQERGIQEPHWGTEEHLATLSDLGQQFKDQQRRLEDLERRSLEYKDHNDRFHDMAADTKEAKASRDETQKEITRLSQCVADLQARESVRDTRRGNDTAKRKVRRMRRGSRLADDKSDATSDAEPATPSTIVLGSGSPMFAVEPGHTSILVPKERLRQGAVGDRQTNETTTICFERKHGIFVQRDRDGSMSKVESQPADFKATGTKPETGILMVSAPSSAVLIHGEPSDGFMLFRISGPAVTERLGKDGTVIQQSLDDYLGHLEETYEGRDQSAGCMKPRTRGRGSVSSAEDFRGSRSDRVGEAPKRGRTRGSSKQVQWSDQTEEVEAPYVATSDDHVPIHRPGPPSYRLRTGGTGSSTTRSTTLPIITKA